MKTESVGYDESGHHCRCGEEVFPFMFKLGVRYVCGNCVLADWKSMVQEIKDLRSEIKELKVYPRKEQIKSKMEKFFRRHK